MKLGQLVRFGKRGGGRKIARPEPAGDAEILIFTGVRYERQDTAKPGKPPVTDRPKRKRG